MGFISARELREILDTMRALFQQGFGELRQDFHTIIHQEKEIMSSIDNLNTAVAALTAEVAVVANAVAKFNANIASLTAEIATLNGGANPAIDAAVTQINAETAALAAAVAPPAAPPAA